MLRHITLAVVALLLAAPAHAATKSDVAAAGCHTFEQTRKANPGEHLHYRLINGEKCWYSNIALAKAKTQHVVKKAIQVLPQAEQPEDDLASLFELLCGGPCPQLQGELRQQWPPAKYND
jgi:hypothetical protein